MRIKSLVNLSQIFFFCLFFFVHYFIVKNVVLLSRDILNADYSIEKIWPAPQYGVGRIPDTLATRQFNAENHLALDFAQVYFPSRNFTELKRNYVFGDFDPAHRPSRYAPFVHFLCSVTYCRLNYGLASFFHLFFQLCLFYFLFIKVFYLLNVSRYVRLGVLIVNVCLFLTPSGVSLFERGQFSLYVALSYLLVTLWIIKGKPMYIILGGVFAFIKWTSFPFIFVVLFVFILSSENFKDLKIKTLQLLPFLGIIIFLLALFPVVGYYFVQGLFQQELFAVPRGVSLVKIVPVIYVKSTPLFLLCLGWLYVQKYQNNLKEYLPFFTGAGILMLMYPTKAYEYNVSTMFCFIPLVVYWAGLIGHRQWKLVRNLMVCIFILFLLSASYSRILVSFFETEIIVYLLYLMVAMIFLIVPLIFPRRILLNTKLKQLDPVLTDVNS